MATLGPTVLAFVLPLVLGQEEHWPAWGWACLAASAVGIVVFAAVERWVSRRGGHPIVSGHVLRLPGLASSIVAIFLVMAVFSGFLFALTLHLQEALGDSALRAALTFAPTGIAFAAVSLSWRRLPARTRLRRRLGRAGRARRTGGKGGSRGLTIEQPAGTVVGPRGLRAGSSYLMVYLYGSPASSLVAICAYGGMLFSRSST